MSAEFPFNDSQTPFPWDGRPAYPYGQYTPATAPDNWAKQKGSESYVLLRAGYSARVYGVFLSRREPPPEDNQGLPGQRPPARTIYEARLNWLKSTSETPLVQYKVGWYGNSGDTGKTLCLECDAANVPAGEDSIIQPWLMGSEHGLDWHPTATCGIIEKTNLWVVRLFFYGGEFNVWIVAGRTIEEVRQQPFLSKYVVQESTFDSTKGC